MEFDGLPGQLTELLAAHRVPGAVLGVSHRGRRFVTAAGTRSLDDPQPVSADTAFQLGSISKVYTASLLLAVAGTEILDVPVVDRLPEAAWMGEAITVRHLLTHSSGLGGDWFADTGRGEDALARYVAGLADQPRDHPLAPGTRHSYCNSGYAVLGRLVEVLTGRTFDDALRAHLLTRLPASRTTTLPEDTMLAPFALGHNRRDPGPLTRDQVWNFARAGGPLGGIVATADDVLAFAEHHLAEREPWAAVMRERHLETPPLTRPDARGLGWGIYDLDGATAVGHDGETLGQIASLRLVPSRALAVIVLTNAIPDGDEVTTRLMAAVLGRAGLAVPSIDAPPPMRGFDPTPYLGRYRNLAGTREVTAAADFAGLEMTFHQRSEGLVNGADTDRLLPIGDHAFVERQDPHPTRAIRFGDPDDGGRMRSCYTGRIAWRTVPGDERPCSDGASIDPAIE